MRERDGCGAGQYYRDAFDGLGRQVFRNWRLLKCGDRASCRWLSRRIERLHREISGSPEFLHAVHQCGEPVAANKSYHWIPLIENSCCRSGLLFLPPDGRISMHDHPCSIGVSLVLDGSPLIAQCDRTAVQSPVLTPVDQQRVRYTRLQPRQKSFLFPHRNNLHGFSSPGSPSLLFNTIFHKQAVTHHSFLPMPRFNGFSPEKCSSSATRKPLLTLGLSMCMALSAGFYAGDSATAAETAVNIASMPFETLERAALDGSIPAQARLAECYYHGKGVEQDLYRAFIWYRRAAEGGFAEAQYQTGIMLLDGEGVTEDSNEGFEWIFRASQAGHARATAVFNYIMDNPVALDC